MKRQNKKIITEKVNPKILMVIAGAFAALLCLYVYLSSRTSFDDGLKYLENQAKTDTKEIETEIVKKQDEELTAAVNNGEKDVFSLFNNSLILGDSRASGYSYYGFLPKSKVLADLGDTAYTISDHVQEVEAMQPRYIYISYGANDILSGLGADSENGYADLMEEQIDELLKVSPDSKIILNSILNVSNQALENNSAYQKIASYNQQLKQLAEKRGWTYIDNSSITNGGNATEYYQSDGVHFISDFYYPWAKNMVLPQYPGLN